MLWVRIWLEWSYEYDCIENQGGLLKVEGDFPWIIFVVEFWEDE